jgi:hypothetical protein
VTYHLLWRPRVLPQASQACTTMLPLRQSADRACLHCTHIRTHSPNNPALPSLGHLEHEAALEVPVEQHAPRMLEVREEVHPDFVAQGMRSPGSSTPPPRVKGESEGLSSLELKEMPGKAGHARLHGLMA